MVLERKELLSDPLELNHRSGLALAVVGNNAVSTFQSVNQLCKGSIRRTGGAMR